MKKIFFAAVIVSAFFSSCDNREKRQTKRNAINQAAMFEALLSNPDTYQVEYLDSLHKYNLIAFSKTTN